MANDREAISTLEADSSQESWDGVTYEVFAAERQCLPEDFEGRMQVAAAAIGAPWRAYDLHDGLCPILRGGATANAGWSVTSAMDGGSPGWTCSIRSRTSSHCTSPTSGSPCRRTCPTPSRTGSQRRTHSSRSLPIGSRMPVASARQLMRFGTARMTRSGRKSPWRRLRPPRTSQEGRQRPSKLLAVWYSPQSCQRRI